ncbi:sugar transferase [Adlercreutzia sp. ZJ242]|uniref:sugar transferase n=1 Tax=Adlercreutzia sp. ZJ242 TaxID=2709409 RepID=UPI0013ED553D|nr:sugar transferase [Adlercreutzia sp. ZJ242]
MEPRAPRGLYERRVKRALDVLCSGAALVCLSPVLGVTALLVRMKLGSPVVFRQGRPGMVDPKTGQERIFELCKFRTMTDARGEDGELLPDEERLTPFGRALRSTSLDELPELVNILKGDMSLVGPRPLLVEYLPLYSEEQRHRHDVRPGLTGWAQVNGRNAIKWEDKFRYDLEYVGNCTLAMDLRVFIATFKVLLRRSGISSETSATMERFAGTPEEGKQGEAA